MSDFSDIRRRSHAEQCQLAGRNHYWTGSRRHPGRHVEGDHQQCLGDRHGRGQWYGGGLAGEVVGSVANSWAAVTVAGTTTTSSSMGGLVGWNNVGGIIQDSYATGNVTAGTGGTRAGGLTAKNNGSILRSYATGAVSGGSQGVGGLVGLQRRRNHRRFLCDRSRDRHAFAGGLVGFNSRGATIVKSYATGSRDHRIVRRWTGRHSTRRELPSPSPTRLEPVNVTSSTHRHSGRAADWSAATPAPSPSPMRPGP